MKRAPEPSFEDFPMTWVGALYAVFRQPAEAEPVEDDHEVRD